MTTETTTIRDAVMEQLEFDFREPQLFQEVLLQAMNDDDDWRMKYTYSIIGTYLRMHQFHYENGTEAIGISALENTFAAVCGWGLSTLILATLLHVDPAEVNERLERIDCDRPEYIRRLWAAAPYGHHYEFKKKEDVNE